MFTPLVILTYNRSIKKGGTPMNEITRYNNQLNTIPMRKWTTEEQNFFFGIITAARDKGTDILHFSKDELIELANYTLNENKRFEDTITNLVDKMETMRYREVTSNSFKSMSLFQYFEAHWEDDLSDMTLDVQVSSKFDYVINKLEANFTQFELKQFTNIRSTYAKEMFKKLKQWRTIGKKEYAIDEFRAMLQIPKSYRATDINQVVLKPIKEELSEYFVGLKVKPVKVKKRGTPVIAYEFTWQPEKTGTWVYGKYENKNGETTRKITVRNEELPDWAKPGYIPPKEEPMPSEKEAAFRERLERFRNKR